MILITKGSNKGARMLIHERGIFSLITWNNANIISNNFFNQKSKIFRNFSEKIDKKPLKTLSSEKQLQELFETVHRFKVAPVGDFFKNDGLRNNKINHSENQVPGEDAQLAIKLIKSKSLIEVERIVENVNLEELSMESITQIVQALSSHKGTISLKSKKIEGIISLGGQFGLYKPSENISLEFIVFLGELGYFKNYKISEESGKILNESLKYLSKTKENILDLLASVNFIFEKDLKANSHFYIVTQNKNLILERKYKNIDEVFLLLALLQNQNGFKTDEMVTGLAKIVTEFNLQGETLIRALLALHANGLKTCELYENMIDNIGDLNKIPVNHLVRLLQLSIKIGIKNINYADLLTQIKAKVLEMNPEDYILMWNNIGQMHIKKISIDPKEGINSLKKEFGGNTLGGNMETFSLYNKLQILSNLVLLKDNDAIFASLFIDNIGSVSSASGENENSFYYCDEDLLKAGVNFFYSFSKSCQKAFVEIHEAGVHRSLIKNGMSEGMRKHGETVFSLRKDLFKNSPFVINN